MIEFIMVFGGSEGARIAALAFASRSAGTGRVSKNQSTFYVIV